MCTITDSYTSVDIHVYVPGLHVHGLHVHVPGLHVPGLHVHVPDLLIPWY